MDYLDYFDHFVYLGVGERDVRRFVRERRDPFDVYTRIEFRERFGFNKESLLPLFDLCAPNLQHRTELNHALSPRLQTLCGLRIYRSGTSQIVGGDLINVHRTTAGRAFHRLTNSLLREKPLFINMPTPEEFPLKKQEFYQLGGFPNVIGAIDCTHIPLLCPTVGEPELFRNRKGFCSLNTQVVCDANMRIMNIVTRWPGSTHDARVWDNSRVAAEFENGSYDGLLVGDSGYALSRHLMTPVLGPRTQGARNYNRAHILSRNIVERTFGVWKKRFQILETEMRFRPRRCANTIVAAAVLHNYGISVGDLYTVQYGVPENDDFEYAPQGNAAGIELRQEIIQNFFS